MSKVKGSINKMKMITAATEERSQQLNLAYNQINLEIKKASASNQLEFINLVLSYHLS